VGVTELHTYRVEAGAAERFGSRYQEGSVQEAFAEHGVHPVACWTSHNQMVLAVVAAAATDHIDGLVAALDGILPPFLDLNRLSMRPVPSPRRHFRSVVEADRRLAHPRLESWIEVEGSPEGRLLWVTFLRGTDTALHHVEVDEDEPGRVIVSLVLGEDPARTAAKLQGKRVLFHGPVISQVCLVRLSRPLGHRVVVDGATHSSGRRLDG